MSRARRGATVTLTSVTLVMLCGCGVLDTARDTEASPPRSTLAYRVPTNIEFRDGVPVVIEDVGIVTNVFPRSYTVQRGDTLFRIASRHDTDTASLCAYNNIDDCDEHTIHPGDRLLIPPDDPVDATPDDVAAAAATTAPAAPAAPTVEPTATTDPPEPACTYVIVGGDTPAGVASRFGVTYPDLQDANPEMDMTTTFPIGGILIIPPHGVC